MCGASFASSISVLSSESLVLGMAAVKGVGETLALEGRVLNGSDMGA